MEHTTIFSGIICVIAIITLLFVPYQKIGFERQGQSRYVDIFLEEGTLPSYKKIVRRGFNKDLAAIFSNSTKHTVMPLIFHESMVQKWKALDWNLLTLAPNWPIAEVEIVSLSIEQLTSSRSKTRTLVAENEREVGGMIHSSEKSSSRASMQLIDFLSRCEHNNESLIYVTDYEVLEKSLKLENDTSWSSLRFVVPEAARAGVNETDMASPLLWIFHRNTALQTRFSAYHIFRAQLKGTSHVMLFPPSISKELRLFPSIHVSHSQSQLIIEEADDRSEFEFHLSSSSVTGNASALNDVVLHAILQPGDLLYIPPFYYTRHRSMGSASLGLDILSASVPQLHLLEAFYTPLPYSKDDFEPGEKVGLYGKTLMDAVRNMRIIAAQAYLLHFISRLRKLKGRKKIPLILSPKTFASDLFTTRYSSIYPENSLFIQRSEFKCLSNKEDISLLNAISTKVLGDPGGPKEKRIKDTAAYAAACVSEKVVPDSVKLEWVADYVEHIGRWAMGDPEETVFFIRECLNFDSILRVNDDLKDEEVLGPSTIRIQPS